MYMSAMYCVRIIRYGKSYGRSIPKCYLRRWVESDPCLPLVSRDVVDVDEVHLFKAYLVLNRIFPTFWHIHWIHAFVFLCDPELAEED